MANIKEEVDVSINGIPVTEEVKIEDGTNPNVSEGQSPEEEGKRCSCGKADCESCFVKFEATINFNKDSGNNNCCQSVSNKELRKCNRCGEEFYPASAYRKHYMKCWRLFRKKATLTRGNKTFNKVNKKFYKKKFSINTENNSFAVKKTCQVCGMHFKSAMHYTMHVRKKGFCRPPPFDCNNCGKTFKNIHHLVNHEKRKTPCARNKIFPTSVEEGGSVIEADTEQATKKGTKVLSKKPFSSGSNLKCVKCNAQFTLFYWYNRHISHPSSCKPNRYKRNKDTENNSFASWKLTGKSALSVEEYKTADGYKCKKCGHIFRFPYRLLAHLQRKVPCKIKDSKKHALLEKSASHENYQESSAVADGVYVQRKLLNSEKPSNVGIKIIKKYWKMAKTQPKKQNVIKYGTLICCICDKTFFNSYTWKTHLKIHSTVGDKCLVKCPVCLSVFTSADELHCHQQETNHWGKLMKSRINHCRCPFCDKKFAYLGSRQNHVQCHLEDYPLEAKEFLDSTTCSYCELYFASEAKKMAHIRKAHPNLELAEKKKNSNRLSEETTMVLTEDSASKSKDKMKHEISPQLQSLLPKSIVNTTSVIKRKKNTKNGNLHSCSFCKKKFVWLERLIAHQQAVHSNCLIFQCSSCYQKFSSWSIIIQHIRKKHKNSKEDNLIIEIGKTNDCASENLKPTSKDQDYIPDANNLALVDKSSQNMFSCTVCKINNFSKRAALLRHKKSRIHRRNLKLNFKSVNKLMPHPRRNEVAIKSVKFNCSICSQPFKTLTAFIPHRLSHFNFENPNVIEICETNPFCCEVCSKLIHQHQKVKSHLLSHLRGGKVKSLLASKSFDLNAENCAKEGLMELSRSNHDVIQDIKEEEKPDNQNFKVNQGENTKPIKKVNFTCKFCNEGFKTNRLRKQHIRYHCRLKYKCKRCEECFPSRKLFLVHQTKAACDIFNKQLHCQYCSLDFSSANDLGWHEKSCQKVHGTERGEFNINNMNNLFHCQYCQSPFLSLETCQEHEQRFCKSTCIICKAHFTSHELLNEHMNEFHDTKQYAVCSVCGIYLKNVKALHVHLKTHKCGIDEKIKNCKNKRRKSKRNKTSACPYCSKTYQGQHSLKEHLVIHNPFKCPVCGKIENDVRGFRKHPCRLPNGTFATGIKYRKKWGRVKIAQMREECNMSLLTEHGGTLQEVKEMPKSEEGGKNEKQACTNVKFQETCLENSDRNDEKVTLDVLRENFSQLLYLFVADPELMNELGWGQRLIDDVLADVLQNMGQSSVIMDATCSVLERLRENIRLLLKVCIKDQVMDAVDGENKLVDDIVVDMLGMCKASLENQMSATDNSS